MTRLAELRVFLESVVEVLIALEKLRLPETGTANKPTPRVDQ